jgi:hypothetical protein
MDINYIYQKIKKTFSSMTMKTKFFWVILFVALMYLIFEDSKGGRGVAGKGKIDDLLARIQQVNMAQAKLCVLKINAKTCLYVEDKMTKMDLTPYKVGYTHNGEVDVVVDLTTARAELLDGRLKIVVLEPHIDEATLNIRPENLKREYSYRGWRTDDQRTAVDNNIKQRIPNDLDQTVSLNFPKEEAKWQSVNVLKSLYATVGFDQVEVEFIPFNADVK